MDKLKFTHIPTNTLTKKLNKTIDKVNNKFKGNYISKKMKNCLDERNHYSLTDAFHDYHMGITAENVATKYNITRRTVADQKSTHQWLTDR